jgi:Rad3-related DNA helicase
MQALVSGQRTCILTSTKGLQDQLVRDFKSTGLVDIRGKQNYQCLECALYDENGVKQEITVDMGPCSFGKGCDRKWNKHKDPEGFVTWTPPNPDKEPCPYYDLLHRLRHKPQDFPLVVTNFSMWMSINKFTEGMGDFDLLVLDEAHNAPTELASFLGVEINSYETDAMLQTYMPQFTDMESWKQWAQTQLVNVEEKLGTLFQDRASDKSFFTALKFGKRLKALQNKLQALATSEGHWVMEHINKGRIAKFDVVWPFNYSEKYLFMATPKILLTSATVRPKTCALLGIDKDELSFKEYPHTFPKETRPVMYIPTVRLNYRSSDDDLKIWVSRIDNIIRSRQDRKGIIHTISYKRRNFLMARSKYADLMLSHDTKDRDATIKQFKETTDPCVLVSPSVTTGFDFPYTECEYQIIGKVPWPDTSTAVMKARNEQDDQYLSYIAMQELVQAAGRGTRAPDDQCEVFVIDDNFWWFIWRNKEHAPNWFLETVRKEITIPQPLDRLKGV